jgi:hypothetical protein
MLLEKKANATKEPVYRRLSKGTQPDSIKSRAGVGNARFLSLVSHPETTTSLEQDLCRNAPLMQAGSAKLTGIKNKNLHSDFCRPDRPNIPGRTRPNDNEIPLFIIFNNQFYMTSFIRQRRFAEFLI